jgi:hypothetical protein
MLVTILFRCEISSKGSAMRPVLLSLSLLGATIALTGCGFTADKILSVAPAGKGTHGRVIGGQAPVVGAVVSVYAVGVGGPATLLASTLSDGLGNFAFNTDSSNTYSCGSLLAVKSPVSPQISRPRPSAANTNSSVGVATSESAGLARRARPADLPNQSETYVYITAVGGNAGGGLNSSITLGAGLGKCIDAQSETVEINEVSTVVLANVMANFAVASGGGNVNFESGTDPYQINAMEIALTNTFQTIDDLPTGTVKPNTVAAGPADTSITIEAAKIYSIANTISSCVNSADVIGSTAGPSAACQTLFAKTGGNDTFSAALFMCYGPFSNVSALYALAGPEAPFVGLPAAPNDWSVGISYSTSAMGFGLYESPIGGGSSSTIDLDSSSRVWFPSNKFGAAGIGYFDPTTNTFFGPFGGRGSGTSYPLVLPQYVALDDPDQIAWVTDTHTSDFVGVDTRPGHEGVIYSSAFNDNFSGPRADGPGDGPLFINSDGSMVVNYDDTAFTPLQFTYDPFSNTIRGQSSFRLQPTGLTLNTTDGTYVNDPGAPLVVAATSDFTSTCNVEFSSANDGNYPFVSQTSGCGLSGGVATGAYNAINGNQDQVAAFTYGNSFCSFILETCSSVPEYLNFPEGVAVDGNDEVWFANSGNASIFPVQLTYKADGTPQYSTVTPGAFLHGAANGNTMTEPIGIAVDRGGNIWVSNASCVSSGDTTCSFTLSEVFGTAYPTFTPLSLQADRLQGTLPPQGSTNVVGSPAAPMLHGGQGPRTLTPLLYK